MRQQQLQEQHNIVTFASRFYGFLKQRDAKIIELFFLGQNIWMLAIFAAPQGTFRGPILDLVQQTAPQLILVIIQTLFTALSMTALIYDKKYVRIIAAMINVAIMSFCATGFALLDNPMSGTCVLLAILAAFVCWKITIRTQ